MLTQNKKPSLVDSKDPAEIQRLKDQEQLNQVANEAAEQAGKTEQRYDQDHGIFTK